jgi:hypothetical protein
VDAESLAMHEELTAGMLTVELSCLDVMHLLDLLGDSEADIRIADVLAEAIRVQKLARTDTLDRS